ncbi:uncharacterized protein LOC121376181 isoform X2 [Gigantopelta aegis]|uniref:uncharacterized protein LOC121376181 isoform X2 n=1 Tax=Gigantopelta aegis TaxID=1735272 RepID=UPI001B887D76|nr:uncharacterized protein LOC121376181 isoform X2 [Gigantopelta aegis]
MCSIKDSSLDDYFVSTLSENLHQNVQPEKTINGMVRLEDTSLDNNNMCLVDDHFKHYFVSTLSENLHQNVQPEKNVNGMVSLEDTSLDNNNMCLVDDHFKHYFDSTLSENLHQNVQPEKNVNGMVSLEDTSLDNNNICLVDDHFKQNIVTSLSENLNHIIQPEISANDMCCQEDKRSDNNICLVDDHFKQNFVTSLSENRNHIIQPEKCANGMGFQEDKSSDNNNIRLVVDQFKRLKVVEQPKQSVTNTGCLKDEDLDSCDKTVPTTCEKPAGNTNASDLKLRIVSKNRILEQSVSSPTNCKRLLTIEVVHGDIAKDNSHVIVSPTNTKLQHMRGAGRHLMNVAGSDVSEELKNYLQRKAEVPVTSVIVTRPGALSCRHLFHAVGPRWRNYKDKSQCRHDLIGTIVKCLFEAYRRKMVSIALPAVSAGSQGVPRLDCAQSYVMALKVFESKVSRGSLRLVRFVDTDSKMVDAIRRQLDAEWDNPFDMVSLDPHDNILDVLTSQNDTTCVEVTSEISDSSHEGPVHLPGPQIDTSNSSLDVKCVVVDRPGVHHNEDTGPMPPGTMTHFTAMGQLPGYKEPEHIVINYTFDNGVQSASHPKPGRKYSGSKFCSYLPCTHEGFETLELLQKAFSRKLLFTVAKESVYSENYVVTWGCISQKRNKDGGRTRYTIHMAILTQITLREFGKNWLNLELNIFLGDIVKYIYILKCVVYDL